MPEKSLVPSGFAFPEKNWDIVKAIQVIAVFAIFAVFATVLMGIGWFANMDAGQSFPSQGA